jgi:hypothetical protein
MGQLQRKEKETEAIFEAIITENFSTLMSDTKSQIKKAQGLPSKINGKKNYI